MRFQRHDPFAMRRRKQVEHAAQLGYSFAFRRSLTQFDSSWRLRTQDEPSVPDGANQGLGRLARNPRHQSIGSHRLLSQVSRQGERHRFAAPRVGRAALHNVAGPEEDVPLLLRELLLA